MSNSVKSSLIQIRVNPKVKKEADSILDELGLTMSQAFHMFIKEINRTRRVPLSLSLDNSYDTLSDEEIQSALIGYRQFQQGKTKKIDLEKDPEA